MNKNQKTTLEKVGWKVGSVAEFLNLSPQEKVYTEKAEPSVSPDLMVRSLCALGASKSEVAKAIH